MTLHYLLSYGPTYREYQRAYRVIMLGPFYRPVTSNCDQVLWMFLPLDPVMRFVIYVGPPYDFRTCEPWLHALIVAMSGKLASKLPHCPNQLLYEKSWITFDCTMLVKQFNANEILQVLHTITRIQENEFNMYVYRLVNTVTSIV